MKLFDISKSETHKTITILGIKFRFTYHDKNLKNKLKELNYKICKYMPSEKYSEYLKDWYYEKTKKELNLNNPKTFNEKIQWFKLYDKNSLKTQLADKYLMRDWVKEKVGEEILIPLLGAWDKFEDINFDNLPEKFVLKCNHGCGYNIIVTDKSKLDLGKTKKIIDEWMHTDFAFVCGLELHYSDIPRKIIAEEYLESANNKLEDYKFYCFHGEPRWILACGDRGKKTVYENYDPDWNIFAPSPKSSTAKKINKPKTFNKMVEFAKKLSSEFVFVRVDFYEVNEKIYLGELTFTPGSGVNTYYQSWDLKAGSWIDLNKLNH